MRKENTFVYKVLETSADIQFLNVTTIQPKQGKKGGCKTDQFLFQCNRDAVYSPKSFVKMRKDNKLGEPICNLTYTVNPENLTVKLTSTTAIQKDSSQ